MDFVEGCDLRGLALEQAEKAVDHAGWSGGAESDPAIRQLVQLDFFAWFDA